MQDLGLSFRFGLQASGFSDEGFACSRFGLQCLGLSLGFGLQASGFSDDGLARKCLDCRVWGLASGLDCRVWGLAMTVSLARIWIAGFGV